jgi:hypothetical protein
MVPPPGRRGQPRAREPARSLVRKEGIEPSPQLRDRNLNASETDASTQKDAEQVRQEASENVSDMHDTGPRGPAVAAAVEQPIADVLGELREAWEERGDVPALRLQLVELLLRLEREEGARRG